MLPLVYILVSLSKRCVDLHTAEKISSCIAGTAGSTACIETYEHALADFGPSARLPVKSGALACRRESLGNSLCEHAWRLLPGTSSIIRSEAQNIYATWMRQLQGHETKPRDCARFYQFHRLKWQPQVFFWAEGTLSWYAFVLYVVSRRVRPAASNSPFLRRPEGVNSQ